MDYSSFTFSTFNKHCSNGIFNSLDRMVDKSKTPIFVCIGSDLVLGDSLGPLIGTLLKNKKIPCYVYGTLSFPITAKEVEKAENYLKRTHPNSTLVAIDAAVGDQEDIGLIRIINKGLRPGLGVNKDLNIIGDTSIIGVVAGKSVNNVNLFNLTRLNLVYSMAENIVSGIEQFINCNRQTKNVNFTAFGA